MKKILLFAVAAIFSVTAASAQCFNLGDQIVNAGIGLGGGYGLPVYVSYEKAITELGEQPLGITGYMGYGAHTDKFAGGKFSYSDLFIAVGANYHILTKDVFDLYAGLRLGYDIGSAKVKYTDPNYNGIKQSASAGGFAYTIHVGARYYFNETWGVNAEIGYGIAILNLGASYKF